MWRRNRPRRILSGETKAFPISAIRDVNTFPVLESEAEAVRLLTEKAAELGSWPRALKKAGLKKVSQTYLDRKARLRAKHKKNHGKKETQEVIAWKHAQAFDIDNSF